MTFLSLFSIFVLACFVGYYVVWAVTPALHTPLMAVTNAISSVIIVGALIAAAAGGMPAAPAHVAAVVAAPVAVDTEVSPTGEAVVAQAVVAPAAPPAPVAGRRWAKALGLLAVVLAAINIFGGFAVTERMLAMYRKKER